jgi:hypothetical protein
MMKSAHLGCFTTTGILAAFLTALIVSGMAFASGGLLFNAGPLNAHTGAAILGGVSSHAEIAGQCTLCHTPFWSGTTMADRCVACHTDVNAQWQDSSTLHGVLRQNNPDLKCSNCHPDHRGSDSPLVDLSNTSFPHNSFGFMLISHMNKVDGAPIGCNDCHNQVYTIFDQAICSTCHTQTNAAFVQTHTENFGNNCLTCHDGMDSYGSNFDHTGIPFQLTGKHVRVPCGQCHINEKTIADLQSTPQDCNSCHAAKDTHQGRLGNLCGSCHTADGWTPAKFDHTLSTFKLTGKHVDVMCANCHVNHVLQGTPSDCVACHAAKDIHNGSLGTDCGACHTTNGWKPSTYDHNLSTFKLSGKHVAVVCANCHNNNVFKGTTSNCFSCHAASDTHKGSLGADCGSCHSTAGWTPSTYDHNLSTFKLTGQHANVSCLNCHTNNSFKGTPSNCLACHQKDDTHHGQFGTDCGSCHGPAGWKPSTYNHNLSTFKLNGQHVNIACLSCHKNSIFRGTPSNCYACHAANDTHTGQFGTDCGTCHSTNGWKPATFNHNLANFKLTGRHANVACLNCHVNNVFRGTPSNCKTCHASDDAHNGQFGSDCGSCHTTGGWKPATFNHNLANFKLTGRHVNVACLNCHVNNVFKGTPSNCKACHASDDAHKGQFGSDCGSCHTTGGWKPATFDHNLSNFKLTGRHVSINCSSCHINNVYKGTPTNCNTCHAGNDTHKGQFGPDCGSCHSTSGWTPANFDHSRSGFALTGAHASLNCSQCHSSGVYSGLSASCNSCHAEPAVHAGMFGTNCGQCHTTNNWNASFSHTGFPLTGAHTTLGCKQCHTNGTYGGLSNNCVNCHAEPAVHAGMFGTDCAQCHSTSNWNATFSHNGFPLTGAHTSLGCTQCHTNGSYGGLSGTCVSCHAEPAVHAGVFGTNCSQCHNTSNWNATFDHPGGCDGNCANHQHATCADCHPVGYNSATCTKCHQGNPGGN